MDFYSILSIDTDSPGNQIVAVIGGGGKSTFITRVATELVQKGLKVIVTATTKIQAVPEIEPLLTDDIADFQNELNILLDEKNIALVAKDYYKDDRLIGISRNSVTELGKFADVVLVEADGTRQRPMKTHKEYEPVIPSSTDHVVVLCGAEVIGKELSNKNVHRAELFAKKVT
jgi:probable selenium-dependent hydroxylase accessory protein YqeC